MVKFLVVRFSSIGDIVLTTPVVRHLKQQVEGAEIHFLTKAAYVSLLEANPYIDRIHSYEGNMKACIARLRAEGFDYVIDLHSNIRSARIKYALRRIAFSVHKLNWLKWLLVNFKTDRLPDRHMVDRNLDTISTFIEERDEQGLDYFIPESSEVDVNSLPRAFRTGFVGLSIGAQHNTKKLPPDSLLSLCDKLEYPVIILGGPEDRERARLLCSSLPEKNILTSISLA